jgi:hypothetical protein
MTAPWLLLSRAVGSELASQQPCLGSNVYGGLGVGRSAYLMASTRLGVPKGRDLDILSPFLQELAQKLTYCSSS